MTLSANRVERHPNDTTSPERIVVRTTYGPITNEVVEDIGHAKNFATDLLSLIEQIEGES